MKTRTVIVATSVVAAAVVLGGVLWALAPRTQSARDVAEQYLAALSNGDLETISSIRDPLLPDEDEQTLRTAFESASSYIAEPRIDSVVPGEGSRDDVVEVRAAAELVGEDIEVGFVLTLQDDRWVLAADYLATLTVTATSADDAATADAARIGDALAPVGAAVALLPASYAVTAAPADLLDGAATVALSSGDAVDLALETQLTPAATERAQEELDAYAAACTATATEVPPSCGLRVPWAADLATVSSISYRVETLPAIDLASGGATEFAATGGVVTATATGTTRAGEPASFTYRADDWALRGSMMFRGDEMLLAVR